MPKIIMFLAFCQNRSQFYHQVEALKNPEFRLKTRKMKSFTKPGAFWKWLQILFYAAPEPVNRHRDDYFHIPSPTFYNSLKNAPLQALECWGLKGFFFLCCCFCFQIIKESKIQSLFYPHLFPSALKWEPLSSFPSQEAQGAGGRGLPEEAGFCLCLSPCGTVPAAMPAASPTRKWEPLPWWDP